MDSENTPEFGIAPECPKGFTPSYKMDAVNEEKRYYRAQWLAERERADALAAHVEQLRSAISPQVIDLVRCGIGSNYGGRHFEDALAEYRDPLLRAIEATPTTSLARRDLIKQAEALEEEARYWPEDWEYQHVYKQLIEHASQLRRQAEGDPS